MELYLEKKDFLDFYFINKTDCKRIKNYIGSFIDIAYKYKIKYQINVVSIDSVLWCKIHYSGQVRAKFILPEKFEVFKQLLDIFLGVK